MKVTMKKEVFLSNSYNKKMLIVMLGECLRREGVEYYRPMEMQIF